MLLVKLALAEMASKERMHEAFERKIRASVHWWKIAVSSTDHFLIKN
ncbi:hypothetical protein [Dyadobacter sp. NIV53]|nr:hypothetical protein [Dyadobacter sp. NIV53]